jgi:DNA-binding MarR family transcriptional regulator
MSLCDVTEERRVMPKTDPGGTKPNSADYQDQSEFRYGIRRFLRFSELQARRDGVTPQQHQLLLVVRGHPSYPRVSIGDIAERLQIKHHSASLLVDRTVKNGLVQRDPDTSDRRRALVSLSPEGEQVLERITLANRGELVTLQNQLFRTSFVQGIRRKRRATLA